MKASQLLTLAAAGAAAAGSVLDSPLGTTASGYDASELFANPDAAPRDFRIPTPYESAVMGRRILALTPLGTLSTVFPEDDDHHSGSRHHHSFDRHRPEGLGGVPVGLVDYVADCEDRGNPTILAINIATPFRNVRAGSNISLSMRWTPPYPPAKRISVLEWLGLASPSSSSPEDRVPYSAANLPRFSLMGYLEKVGADEAEAAGLSACFVRAHPDARYWLPGNRIHSAEWARLVVTRVYWVGGFGDRAYIGWIPAEEWGRVTAEEWQGIRLPGEKKGWKEWSVGEWSESDL
ncbi:uncharacterized protein E0L32_012267 [Thyridium curvatum]|uniref:CREG-like beta-barrel domain-containing protein n=1 Tax=Thyridium curvatum TaxID=1093900 RepID=A0A507BIM2_9PEZI|nr:uncharacterized protein E0L32_012267 [Thyridium curvatum]TPX17259.1 hypothetical protein E0L32_012267 [Thyridium curvatum]